MLLHKCLLVVISFFLSMTWAQNGFAEQLKILGEKDPADVLLQDGDLSVTWKDFSIMLESMAPAQKHKLASDKNELNKLLYANMELQKQAQEAVKQGLLDNPLVQWRLETEKQKILAQALQKHWRDNLTLAKDFDMLAREYYDAHPEEFTVEEKIEVAHILFSDDVENKQQGIEQRKTAEQVLNQLKSGEMDFAEAAKQYSADKSTANRGGELGFFGRGRMVKPFEDVAFTLQETGELSNLVKTQFGLHIIKLLDRRPAGELAFEEVKPKLVAMHKEKFIAAEREKYLNSFNVDQETTVFVPLVDEAYKLLKNSIANK